MTNDQIFWLWLLGFPAAGVILGFAGRRIPAIRYVAMAVAPLYSGAFYVYGWFGGGPDECVTAPQPPGYVCHPTSFVSEIGSFGVVVFTIVTVVSCTPLLSIWLGTRVPTVVGAVVLIAFIVINVFGFFFWVPAASALVASAIAGPPRRRGTVQQSSA